MATVKRTVRSNPYLQSVPLPMESGVTTMPRDAEVLLDRVRREAEHLSQELQRLRGEFDELSKQIAGDLEASRQEIERLARCVQELERLVTQAPPPRTPAHAPSWPSKSLFTFLGRSNFPGAQ